MFYEIAVLFMTTRMHCFIYIRLKELSTIYIRLNPENMQVLLGINCSLQFLDIRNLFCR